MPESERKPVINELSSSNLLKEKFLEGARGTKSKRKDKDGTFPD